MKDKSNTKSKLVNAVGEIVAESGFSKIGVNAVARHAGVDKVLIYRYFENLEGLYRAYARSAEFWPSLDELLGSAGEQDKLMQLPAKEVLAEVFKRYSAALRSRPLTLEILAWETVERNALTVALEGVREEFGLALAQRMQSLELPDADWLTISNIFTGAIHYFALRARKISTFSGMQIDQDEFWLRFNQSIKLLINGIGESHV